MLRDHPEFATPLTRFREPRPPITVEWRPREKQCARMIDGTQCEARFTARSAKRKYCAACSPIMEHATQMRGYAKARARRKAQQG